MGIEHALLSNRLYTDGAEILYDFTQHEKDPRLSGLTVVRNNQRVLAPIMTTYLKRIQYIADGVPGQIELRSGLPHETRILVNPQINFGQPYLSTFGIGTADIFKAHRGGDSLEEIAADYEIPLDLIESVISDPITYQMVA